MAPCQFPASIGHFLLHVVTPAAEPGSDGHEIDLFSLRESLVQDYKSFTTSFVWPRDARVRELLRTRLEESDQWPDPWLSLNPSFATGGTPSELVAQGILHPGCERIFRIKEAPEDPGRNPIVFHRHQRDAIEAAATGQSYVLTTGTGSGKSLAYIVPIVDRVLRDRERRPRCEGGCRISDECSCQ